MIKTWLARLAMVLLSAGAALAQEKAARAVTDEDVDRAVGEAVRYIYGQQQPDGQFRRAGQEWQLRAGSSEALGLFALLEAGENPQSEKFKLTLDYLVRFRPDQTNVYVVSMRVMVLSRIIGANKTSPYLPLLKQDVGFLTRNLAAQGAWDYNGTSKTGDNSVSQFGLLALWEAEKAGIEFNTNAIKAIEKMWVQRQQKDGGWTYQGLPNVKADSTLTMTTAGIASLFICQDVLQVQCAPYAQQDKLNNAWEYLTANLTPDYYKNGYLAFCVQRIGMASGAKFIGDLDWFALGAAALSEPNPAGRDYFNTPNGKEYGPLIEACFELIFLSRGRVPLTFNKLQYGQGGVWNVHPRDVARFTDYMWKNFEARMRWQVVDIGGDIEMMQDAPILFVTGSHLLNLTHDEWTKLKDYTLRGGTLLFMPAHEGAAFVGSVKKDLEGLYDAERTAAGGANYRLEQLPDNHPIYSLLFKFPNGKASDPMWGLSDGTRLLAILSDKDLAHAWQRRELISGKKSFEMGANLYFYATGNESPRSRLRPVFRTATGTVKQTAKVAWMKHGGNWNTQPYALKAVSDKLTAENRVALDVEAGVPFEPNRLAGKNIAWVTGSSEFAMTDAEVAALRTYIDDGGTVFVNPVGGSQAFKASWDKVARQLFAGKAIPRNVPNDSPLMTGKAGGYRGPILEKIDKTRAMKRSGSSTIFSVWEQYGRAVVVMAPDGVHDTLDGHTAYGAFSFMPNTARDIACNVILYALMDKPKAPTTQEAATQEATTAPTR